MKYLLLCYFNDYVPHVIVGVDIAKDLLLSMKKQPLS